MKIKDREEPSDLSDAIYKQMANITIMVTQLVVEFAKHLPGFMTLNRDDQIVLLKVSTRIKQRLPYSLYVPYSVSLGCMSCGSL